MDAGRSEPHCGLGKAPKNMVIKLSPKGSSQNYSCENRQKVEEERMCFRQRRWGVRKHRGKQSISH